MNGEQAFYFSRASLSEFAARVRESYATAQPFPHVVIDDFFPDDTISRIIDDFPPLQERTWHGSGMTRGGGFADVVEDRQFPVCIPCLIDTRRAR